MPRKDEPTAEISQIRQKIKQLTDEQVEALKRATFTGMTANEAKMNDARRITISQLIKQLAAMQKGQ